MHAQLRIILLPLIALLGGCTDSQTAESSTIPPQPANYQRVVFHLDSVTTVERVMQIDEDSLVFFNHTERIAVPLSSTPDFRADFTLYHSAIALSSGLDSGYWEIYDRDEPYRVPLSVTAEDTFMSPTHTNVPDTLVYAVTFNPNTASEYPAIGRFLRSADYLSGTFQTETGDYRFLEGRMVDNTTAYLSCFDGSHLFKFSLHFNADSIRGVFSSGLHYRSPFHGVLNPNFTLTDPFSITEIVADMPVSVPVLSDRGDSLQVDASMLQGKVTLLQIMGTWCPNCLDESNYLREFHQRFPDVQIIGLAYERGTDINTTLPRLMHYRQKLRLPYPLYLAGQASKAFASDQFPMLSGISSFPTTLVIGPDATIRFTHTGFNGPGTGVVFERFTERFEAQINALLKELAGSSIS